MGSFAIDKEVCITKKNIFRGKRGLLSSCPIALACKRVLRLRGKDSVEIGEDVIDINKKGILYSMVTPEKAKAFIDTYDDEFNTKKSIAPFCFQLRLQKQDKLDV